MRLLPLTIAAISALALTACAKETTPPPANEIAATSCVTATLTYADWCSSCKILDPKVTEAKAALGDTPVSFVTLDYTAKDADAFFAAADTAGVGTVIRQALSEEVKTGLLFLVNTQNNTLIDKITKTSSAAEITTALTTAANSCAAS